MMFMRLAVVSFVVLVGLAYEATKPPPPKICGSPNGPPVTSPRIRLSDGRFLAYKELGVPKEKAKYKIIAVHGFDSSKDFHLPASQELIDDLGIYFLSFDRAGYGDSDPNPKRSVTSEAFDIQELADQLELGERFYIIGASMGGYSAWSCLKHIPHRIAGASLIAPVVNYWWPSFPASLSGAVFKGLLLQDQWVFRVAHYAPGLLYWWCTQKWFPALSMLEGKLDVFSSQDVDILKKLAEDPSPTDQGRKTQQGVFESLHRDLMVSFGKWDFEPMELSNPFLQNESYVQIWQGDEDKLVPAPLQRYVSAKLPWVRYFEVRESGHLFLFETRFADAILRSLLLGEEPSADLLQSN